MQYIRLTKLAGLLAFICVLGMESGRVAQASVIVFNNLAPATDPYPYDFFGTGHIGTFANAYSFVGVQFAPSATGQLDELWAGWTGLNGSLAGTLTLRADASGLPGAALWQSAVTIPANHGSLLHLSGIGGPTLTQGQNYWLMAEAPQDGVTYQAWWANSQNDLGNRIINTTLFPNSFRQSLRVGVRIPEPGTMTLAFLGCLAFIRRHRSRHEAVVGAP